MHKILFVILAIATSVAFGVIHSGSCGDSVEYSLDTTTKKLTITGSGKMKKFSQGGAPWYSYRSSISTVSIASGVKRIGDYAFYDCDKMTSISMSSTVTDIGDYAFSKSGITSISVPSRVEKVSKHAFANCPNLKSASVSSPKIAEYAFTGCKNLNSVTISSATISDYAFSGCSGMTSAKLNSVRIIGERAFSGCSKLQSISIPSGVTTIQPSTFSGCSGLTSLTIGSGVTTISKNAFWGCSSLTSVVIPNKVATIADGAFSYCSRLASVYLPTNLRTIGSGVFRGCGFTSLVIPSGVTTIESEAFAECEKMVVASISDTVTSIKGNAFKNCSSLQKVIYYGTSDPMYSTSDPFVNCDKLNRVCVSRSYRTNSFCHKTVYPDSQAPELEALFNETNSCYEAFICSENEGVLLERSNATKWENQVSPCRTYYCDNTTGPSAWSKCNTTLAKSMICLSETCVVNNSVTKQGWTVVISFTSVMASEFDKAAFLDEVTRITGVSGKIYASEIDSDGFLERAYLIVSSDASAYNIADKLNEVISKGTCNYDLLCEGENITVIPKDPDLSSGYQNFGSFFLLFMVVIISIVSLF